MFPIQEVELLAPDIKRFVIHAPRIARKQRPGQFVILRVHDHGERIPITIAGSDPARGTITLIVQGIGKTTKLLNTLGAGDAILDVAGPLGKPSEVDVFGTVVVIGGGVGAAIAYPTAMALKDAGNRVVSILGARTGDLLVLRDELGACSDDLVVTTDDGSAGRKGVVTVALEEVMAREPVNLVLAIGPLPMMRAVAATTRAAGIRTVVSLNTIMVDGTGMCGGCRVIIGGKTQFACVDGPEFDAHEVDFDVMGQRNAMYRQAEKAALDRFVASPERDLALVAHPCALDGTVTDREEP